jgi:hypothetical protein
MAKEKEEPTVDKTTGTTVPRVNWDQSSMKTSYANVMHVSSTREEFTVLFGTNVTLFTGQNEVTVKLSERIILSPYAAKRLSTLLNNVVNEYEKRFGQLGAEVQPEPRPAGAPVN